MPAQSFWFIFQGSQLLVSDSESAPTLPSGKTWRTLARHALRTHTLTSQRRYRGYAVEVDEAYVAPEGYRFTGLRTLFGVIDEDLLSLAGLAFQIIDWDRTHVFCSRCATPTEHAEHEQVRICPACQLRAYPRIAPVVMGLIVRNQEILLARSPHFAPGMYSAVAGFCEAGESLEEALHREIQEEVGVTVTDLQYFRSQPWPFPHSLMVAFVCEYESGIVVPQPSEIEDARWFSVDALPLLPHPVSIARKLIDATVAQIKSRYHALH